MPAGERRRLLTSTALIKELLEAPEQGGLGKRLAHLQKLDMPILLDRLTHPCHVLEFNGDTYRFKESLRREEACA